MGTKNLSLSDEAYMRLKRLKRGNESFSDVVLRLTGREDILQYVGAISEESADKLRAAVAETRKDLEKAFDRRIL